LGGHTNAIAHEKISATTGDIIQIYGVREQSGDGAHYTFTSWSESLISSSDHQLSDAAGEMVVHGITETSSLQTCQHFVDRW
jgi:hypothetical protein